MDIDLLLMFDRISIIGFNLSFGNLLPALLGGMGVLGGTSLPTSSEVLCWPQSGHLVDGPAFLRFLEDLEWSLKGCTGL